MDVSENGACGISSNDYFGMEHVDTPPDLRGVV